MPTYELVASELTTNYGLVTDYAFCPGTLAAGGGASGTEANRQILVRSTLSLKNLFVRVTANTVGSAQTVRTRVNGVNGNLSVSITASGTGVFEDTTNSDSLVTGDLYALQIVGALGVLTISIMGLTLNDTTGNNTLVASTTLLVAGENFAAGTFYTGITGRCLATATEADAQYTVRDAGTYSNLRVYVITNSTVAATTIRFRKNTANGNQNFSIAGGATGSFEDTTNSDSVVAGDIVNYQAVVADNSIVFTVYQSKLVTTNQPMAAMSSGILTVSADQFVPINGNAGDNISVTETPTQKTARSSFTASKMYVRVQSNGVNAGVNIFFRLNTANSALTVNVPATTSGIFEDTTNTVSVVSGDLYNWFIDHAGAGSISFTCIGFGDGPTDLVKGGGYPSQMHNRKARGKGLGRGFRVPVGR